MVAQIALWLNKCAGSGAAENTIMTCPSLCSKNHQYSHTGCELSDRRTMNVVLIMEGHAGWRKYASLAPTEADYYQYEKISPLFSCSPAYWKQWIIKIKNLKENKKNTLTERDRLFTQAQAATFTPSEGWHKAAMIGPWTYIQPFIDQIIKPKIFSPLQKVSTPHLY